MRIAITGACGFIGKALTAHFESQGHAVFRIGRTASKSTDLVRNIDVGELDATNLEVLDAVIHLAGENLSRGRFRGRLVY